MGRSRLTAVPRQWRASSGFPKRVRRSTRFVLRQIEYEGCTGESYAPLPGSQAVTRINKSRSTSYETYPTRLHQFTDP